MYDNRCYFSFGLSLSLSKQTLVVTLRATRMIIGTTMLLTPILHQPMHQVAGQLAQIHYQAAADPCNKPETSATNQRPLQQRGVHFQKKSDRQTGVPLLTHQALARRLIFWSATIALTEQTTLLVVGCRRKIYHEISQCRRWQQNSLKSFHDGTSGKNSLMNDFIRVPMLLQKICLLYLCHIAQPEYSHSTGTT